VHCNGPWLFTRDWLTNRPTTGSRRNDFVAPAHRFQAHACSHSSRAAHGIAHFQDPSVILPLALNPDTEKRHRIPTEKQLQPLEIASSWISSFYCRRPVWIHSTPSPSFSRLGAICGWLADGSIHSSLWYSASASATDSTPRATNKVKDPSVRLLSPLSASPRIRGLQHGSSTAG
jgi:hypothetical protein